MNHIKEVKIILIETAYLDEMGLSGTITGCDHRKMVTHPEWGKDGCKTR
jgi:hypothetical protein